MGYTRCYRHIKCKRMSERFSEQNSRMELRAYLEAAAQAPLLTAEQEIELGTTIQLGLAAEKRMRDGDYSDEDLAFLEEAISAGRGATNDFAQANTLLVVKLARKLSRNDAELLDSIQDGNVGLVKAVKKFDPTRGFRFSTMATWWIKQAIQRGSQRMRYPVHVPTSVQESRGSLFAAYFNLRNFFGDDFALEDTWDFLPENIAKKRPLIELSMKVDSTLSLDAPIGAEGSTARHEHLADTKTSSFAYESAELNNHQTIIDYIIEQAGLEAHLIAALALQTGYDHEKLDELTVRHPRTNVVVSCRELVAQVAAGEELSTQEISSALGLKYRTYMDRRKRALERLRAVAENEAFDLSA